MEGYAIHRTRVARDLHATDIITYTMRLVDTNELGPRISDLKLNWAQAAPRATRRPTGNTKVDAHTVQSYIHPRLPHKHSGHRAPAPHLKRDELYRHPDNAELRKTRPNPNVLHPGDRVVIPDRPVKTVAAATDTRHRFTPKLAQRELRLKLLDARGRPIAGEPYTLAIGDDRITGQTDGAGLLGTQA